MEEKKWLNINLGSVVIFFLFRVHSAMMKTDKRKTKIGHRMARECVCMCVGTNEKKKIALYDHHSQYVEHFTSAYCVHVAKWALDGRANERIFTLKKFRTIKLYRQKKIIFAFFCACCRLEWVSERARAVAKATELRVSWLVFDGRACVCGMNACVVLSRTWNANEFSLFYFILFHLIWLGDFIDVG